MVSGLRRLCSAPCTASRVAQAARSARPWGLGDACAQITDLVLAGYRAFLARRPATGNACSATAGTEPGVISWWVQFRADGAGDPCQDAQNLLTQSLSSDL